MRKRYILIQLAGFIIFLIGGGISIYQAANLYEISNVGSIVQIIGLIILLIGDVGRVKKQGNKHKK